MVEYATLLDKVIGIVKEVVGYRLWEIITKLEEAEAVEDNDFRARWKRLTFDICEDKRYCSLLGASRLTDGDFDRIKACAYLLVRENPNIVLPYLY